MRPVYVNEHGYHPHSIFLAGPTPRDSETKSWRPQALELLKDFDGEVYVPETSDGQWRHNYDDQIIWETRYLEQAKVILFWVPRDLISMPAFTTNVEFGLWLKSGKIVYGHPEQAQKMKYLDWHARQTGLTVYTTLEETITTAVEKAYVPSTCKDPGWV